MITIPLYYRNKTNAIDGANKRKPKNIIMKKLIDIPEKNNIFRDLNILAAKAGKDLKNFIQNKLIELVEKARENKEL